MSALSQNAFAPELSEKDQREVDTVLAPITWLVTCDAAKGCIHGGALAMEGDTLAGVGTIEEITSLFRGRKTMDLSGFLLLPGLVNTHAHGAMSCLRGVGDDLPLQRWLHEVVFPAEAAIVNEEMVYWGTMLSAVEMLQNGITTFCDGYFFEEAAARAALDSGMRAVLGQGILDFPSPDAKDPALSRRRAEAFLKGFPTGSNRIRPSLFCHAPYTCRADTLQWVKSLCREAGILFQIHLSETRVEVEQLLKEHGERPVFTLDRLGILDAGTLCAHGVWVDKEEMEVLARRGAGISHNVESNMKLASGIAPVPEMIRAGIRVGIGTDGCASNNDLDIFSEMDKMAKLHKVSRLDPEVCAATLVLPMATLGGAAVMGLANEIGSLQVGKRADCVAIDLDQPHLTPLYDPVSHLVYAVKGSDVRHVWVDGTMVVCDGMVQTVAVEEVMREVNRLARKVKGLL